MARLRICPTAQRLMDKLYDEVFTRQVIRNDIGPGFHFTASSGPTCIIYMVYRGTGTTLLKAIRKAIADGPS